MLFPVEPVFHVTSAILLTLNESNVKIREKWPVGLLNLKAGHRCRCSDCVMIFGKG